MSKQNLKTFCFIFAILFFAGFFGFVKSALAAKVLISAVQTAGLAVDDDFIELYNSSCNDIDLSGWKLKKRTSSGSESSLGALKNTLSAKGYFLWENISGNLDNDPDYKTKTYYLSGNYSIALFDPDDNQIDSLTWGINPYHFDMTSFALNPSPSWAIRRNNDNDISYENNYIPKNSSPEFIETDELDACPKPDPTPPPVAFSDKIIINELLPKPDPENTLYKEEFVELFNGGDADEKLDGWYLQDRAKKTCDLSGEMIAAGGFLVVKNDPDKKCALALNDTQGEVLGLYDPKDNLVSSVSYDGSAKKGKSYSFDGESWRWSQYLTPNEDNLFNSLPIVSSKKENKIYVGVYARFSAKGSDKDGEKLKFTWDFGDGHKSYLQNTRHKYIKTGNYTAVLKVTDGNEDVLENFQIKVIKFPKIKISIKEFSANPAGADAKGEYILVKNESKKKINLKGWSVATGSKNLYNHPITEDFILKSGQSKKITRKYSRFALANKKCKIEIRYPNGKVASKLKYEKEKIAEDEIYKKIGGQWVWIAPLNKNKLAAIKSPVENNPVIVEADDTEIRNNLGKYSEDPRWQKKKENKIILASYATHLSLPKDFGNRTRVLGASTVRGDSAYFSFGRPYMPEPHWAVKFMDYLAEILNSALNSALNFFS